MSSDNSEEEVRPPSPLHLPDYLDGNSDYQFHEKELRLVEEETQRRIKTLLEGTGELSKLDPQTLSDPEILRRLTSSVSSALDEAASALTRMRSEGGGTRGDITPRTTSTAVSSVATTTQSLIREGDSSRLLAEACAQGDWLAVQSLLAQGRGLHEPGEDGESLLSLACSAGYYELVEVLLKMRAGVEDRGLRGEGDCTPLMEAASGGYADIVSLLLDHGAEVNAKSAAGNTALTYACCGGYGDVVKVLLDAGALVEEPNENGHTPLMEAASGGHIAVAKLLLQRGANINTHSAEFKESALTLACYKGHLEMVRFLLEAGADQEHKTDEMHTALMEASMDGHVDVARLLLDHGAQVNMPADSFESPLTLAASGGHYELAALLISRGADLEEVNDEGYTPLMEAAREGHEHVVRLLMESGANNEAQTEETQETALTLACCGGFLSVVQYLLERGAGLEQGASTPLMEAAQEGHYEVVQYLIQQGANIHATSAALDTAFSCACSNGHSKVADLLLRHGSDLEHPSEGGRTPLMKAARAGHMDTVRFLVDRGADVNRWTTSRDHTVLSLACAGGHLGIVQYLITQGADPVCFLKDNSTMLIEAARGGHTAIVCLLLKQAMGLPMPLSVPTLPHPPATHAPPTLQQQALVQASQVGLIEGMTHALRHQALPPRNIPRTAVGPTHQLPDGVPATMAATLPAFTQPSGPRKGLGSSTSRKRAAPEDSSDDSSDEEQGLPLPHTQRLDPIGQSPQTIAMQEHVQPMMPVVPMRLPSNSYLGDFDNPRLPDFLPPRNRGLLKPLRGTGMRRAFSLEAIPSELMYHSLDSPAYQLEGCPGHAYQPSVGLPLVPGVGREAEFSNIPMPTNQEILQFQEMLVRRVQEAQGQPGGFYDYNEDDDFDDEGPGRHGDDNDEDDGGEGDDEDEGDEDDMDPPDRCFAGPPEAILPPPRGRAPRGLALQLDAQTESNHDTALTLAAQGGHDELVQVLLAHGSDLEHRDKKGCTPLILAASAGHSLTVSILLEHGAIIEAVSDRTKDTALSLACSGGRQEVVDILLQKGGNFEHRNVSDYTPLSLAASGGYVSIMKALLKNGADVNSRTGSKLGISPLMLAAMNGHTQAAKLLLDHGADINAQIETNRNTALTLACFQGRHEVVSLLCQRAANVEHRAKTGLTPLMEAASGGYHEVGRILVEHGADVNALPVPSSKDTALTIAADKGHAKFVEMILRYGANVDVKNKKGNSPLWLACNGGHQEAVRCLVSFKADPDSQDNRKVSCLMIAFRKGHVKVVKYLVDYVSHFPADSDCKRFSATLSDKDHAKKCSQCLDIISSAKERQAAEANKNASILLQELDLEKQNEEQKKLAAAKKRERKKRQKEKKKAKASEDTKADDELAAEVCDEIEEVKQPEVLVVMTTASTSAPSTSAVATVTTVVSIATHATSLPCKPVVTTTATVSAALRSESVPSSPRNSKVDTVATRHSTAGVTTTTSANTTVATSSTVTPVTVATISPRKGRKEEGWREVPKKSKVATRRPRPTIHPPHSPLDLPHHHGNQLVGRDNKVKLNFTTPPPHLSPQPSPPTSLAQAGSGRSEKLGRGKPSAVNTPHTQPSPPKANSVSNSQDNSVTMPTTKSTLVTPSSSQPTPMAQGSGPVRKRLPSQHSANCSQPSPMVVTTTIAVTTKQAISTVTSSVRSLSQVICQGGKSPVSRLTTTASPAATSVTMTTKKPISSTTVSTKSKSVDVKMAKKMAVSRQPESRAKSTASKGISYSAVVGGTKVKEDNPAFCMPLLSTTLSSMSTNSDGVYQPFGPVQLGNSPPKTTSSSPDKEWAGSNKKALGLEAWVGGGAGDPSPWVFGGAKASVPGDTAMTPSAAESASSANSKMSPVPTDSPLSVSTSTASSTTMTGKECSKVLGPIGPPSRPDKSPQYSTSHSHSPPHTTADHTRELTRDTLSSPDATPPSSRKDGRGHPLLPTPIGPPPAMRGVGDSPTQFPLKSPTIAMMPVGGAAPFSVRSPRPPLLSTPPFPTTVPQPHMAIFPMPVLTDPLPPGMYPDPASLGAEPQGMFPFTKNSGSGFNPNATPFIPTFVQRLPGQPVAAAAGDASPQGMMGVPLDQLPRGVVVQSPHMQAMYPNQFNQHQDGPPKPPTAEGEWGKPFNQRGLLPVPPVLMPGGAVPALPVTMVAHPAMSPGSVPTMLLPMQPVDTAGGGSIAVVKGGVATRLFDYLPPIGTERAHKRSSSHGSPASFGQMPLTSDASLYGGQVWSYTSVASSDDQKAPSGYPWTDNVQTATGHTSAVSDGEGGVADEEETAGDTEGVTQGDFTIAASDSIETILDRLSLSQHLELFQKNEIDFNALLLMTDKDYKEMGLEEGPRQKLLSAIVGSRSHSGALGENSTQTEGAWPEENTQSSEQ